MNPRLISVSLLAALLVALLALGHPVRVKGQGNLMMLGAGATGAVAAAAASFTGLCDLSGVTCTAYYAAGGCAQAAYSGNVVDAVDAATGNTIGTRLQCSNGVVSALVSGSACTFVTGNACSSLATTCATSCTFSTVYNQMGTATFPNLNVPATLANRSTISAAALNSKPCFVNTATQAIANATSLSPSTTPISFIAVSERTASFTAAGRIISSAGGTVAIGYRASANTVGSQGGSVTNTASDSAFHSLGFTYNAASSFIATDGSAGTTGTPTGSWSAAAIVLQNDSSTGFGTSVPTVLCEAAITSNAIASYSTISTNARLANRWGSSF